ncbi:MAG: TRAP transporter permease [Lawsonibacter sp.]
MRTLTGFWRKVVVVMSVALVAFQLYTAGFGVLPDIQQRSVHLFFVLAMIFILKPVKKGVCMGHVPYYDILLAVLCMISTGYMFLIYNQILWDPSQWINTFDKICAVVLMVLIIEASRRCVGWTFPIMGAFFLFYAAFGQVFPGDWAHKNFTFDKIFQNLYHTTNGIWGQMVGLSAGMLAMFGIFGAMLSKTGGSQTFIKFAEKLTGKTVGGPGKVSLVASGLFGMVSGSAMANVVATGTFTIPMMRKAGYNKEWSAAISAVGSTGGQIMPPIMGSGAFIMAQLIGVAYLSIAKSATLPAILFYEGAFVALHYMSKRMGIYGEEMKEKIGIFETANIFVPLIIFIIFLVMRYTVTKAAFYSTIIGIVTYAVCQILGSKNVNTMLKNSGSLCFETTMSGASSILSMAGLLAGAQISIALISQTGFGVKLSSMIVKIGQGNLFLCLLLSMMVCFILGMGMPPTAAYVLAASVLAPALTDLGLQPLVAHLFVFYFATIGAITPPVCAAVFLASGIAESNWLKTGGLSVLLAIPAFVVPFTFAYNQALLLDGALMSIIISAITGFIGVFFIGMAIAGYTNKEVNMFFRMVMFVGGVCMIIPDTLLSVVGIILCAASYLFSSDLKRGKKSAEA